MNLEEYYMALPKDLSGSITKNRFRMELLWGVSKIIDAHKESEDYSVIFDFKCDIELHKEQEMFFYQIKTRKSGSFNENNLCKINNKENNSILGKLYALYSPNQNIKLAIVCNKPLKIRKKDIDFYEKRFGEIDKDAIDEIKNKLRIELNIESVNIDNVFYIFDEMDFQHPEDAIKGKLISSFEEIKNEEPQNPNALYRLVMDTVKQKAAYELDVKDYEEVKKKKGITRTEFDRMLDSHKKESKNGINETQNFINTLSLRRQRKYNIALSDLLEIQNTESLRLIRVQIFNYIRENEDSFIDEEDYLNKISRVFNNDFNIEITNDMKDVQYLIVYFIYATGGEI
ncbi:DUF4297 domain-containing protein [Allofustis seminis]|uniref:DUF4297 domain-containing protein n=1 Tax=Allofustis seminis TaxID=166939 RepID=UPI00036066F5|nr:DUF4297 domain-containing protein [Allofustis seminis]